MRRPPSSLTLLSGFAIALFAAALGDPLVETVANTGIFGRGFVDDNHQSVVPALVAGIVLGLVLLVARFRFAAAGASTGSRDWLREVVSGLSSTSSSRHVAPIFAAQMAIVYAMESCEQLLAPGTSFHGLSWLGAPIAFSLPMHFAVCVFCVYFTRRATRAILPRFIAAVCAVLDRILVTLARDGACSVFVGSDYRLVLHVELTAAERIRGRAPPSLAALV
jgi:hypothetical protein